MVITYLYYFHVSPQLFPRWSLPVRTTHLPLAPSDSHVEPAQWVAISLVGLWLLFNILWNYLHCAFTHPVRPRPMRGAAPL